MTAGPWDRPGAKVQRIGPLRVGYGLFDRPSSARAAVRDWLIDRRQSTMLLQELLIEGSFTVEFEHALAVGGTGMLVKVSRYLSGKTSNIDGRDRGN